MNCYILIGGRSRRMGRPKEELFLDRVAGTAAEVFENVIAVQRNGGAAASIATIYESPHDDQAPVFGVARALEHAPERCFILAVDYPLITAAVLRFLRERFESSSALLLAPIWSGKTQMLCGGYDSRLLPRIEQRIAAKRYDLRGLASESEAEILAEDELRARFDGEPLMNVNTVDEWSVASGQRSGKTNLTTDH
ncbi:MAG: molybdenum cofactor guanylyltransferase [Acidobacteria bacterium]|nr:molybdenum cofactor guanylyltransferase [Acidobacteriota bacterium]MBV9071799.1 molybdenum cofactor guanylyltransferase [Acidobacteriota bacterium]MBV9187283.1 molybdenum cofactor guanylyltransferase [Acidobacteriota bacterium]